MTKRYSVPKNRYFVVCLVNEPWFYERKEPVSKAKQIASMIALASMLAMAGQPVSGAFR